MFNKHGAEMGKCSKFLVHLIVVFSGSHNTLLIYLIVRCKYTSSGIM